MRKLKIYKDEEDSLYFILDQFITTHGMAECKNIYKKELKLSKRLLKESKEEFAKKGAKE